MGNESSTELPYYFHYEAEFAMDLTHNIQFYFCITALFTIHPLALYVLIWESSTLSREIRIGYIVNQVSLIVFEWVYGVFIQIYPLCPYPGIHCGGLLCGRGIPPQILLAILAFAVILPCPPYEYLVLALHQKLIQKTNSKVRIPKRSQNAIIAAIVGLLALNVVGFVVFGKRTNKANEILTRPELAWLASKGGEVFMFGDVGDAESFANECYILSISVALIMPYVWFFTFHSWKVFKKHQRTLSDEAMGLQLRILKVLPYQYYGVLLCFAMPCCLVSLGSNFGDTLADNMPHPRVLSIGRFLFTILHNLYSLPFSLTFLLLNQSYRRCVAGLRTGMELYQSGDTVALSKEGGFRMCSRPKVMIVKLNPQRMIDAEFAKILWGSDLPSEIVNRVF